MLKVLYLAAGNPLVPCVGMDRVCHEHLQELGQARNLRVDAVAVAPGVAGHPQPGEHLVGRARLRLFVGDLKSETAGWRMMWRKLKLVLGRAVPVMAYSFKSRDAARYVSQLIASQQYDVIVVDHFYALANIRLLDLWQSQARVIYISHDAMLSHIAEMAQTRSGLIAKTYYYAEAVRAYVVERILFGVASFIVHLSDYERGRASQSTGRHLGLLPPLCGPAPGTDVAAVFSEGAFANTIVFVGAPAHFPNAQAIDWILQQFAPVLAHVAPHLRIALVGAGTDALSLPANVQGHGFVSADQMALMLDQGLCSISPVVHGRGIKVKVLESIAAGCPVFATAQSLRGFDAFAIEPQLHLDRPDDLAQKLLALSQSPRMRQALRTGIQARWQTFLADRHQKLATLVSLK